MISALFEDTGRLPAELAEELDRRNLDAELFGVGVICRTRDTVALFCTPSTSEPVNGNDNLGLPASLLRLPCAAILSCRPP